MPREDRREIAELWKWCGCQGTMVWMLACLRVSERTYKFSESGDLPALWMHARGWVIAARLNCVQLEKVDIRITVHGAQVSALLTECEK